jgi:zinc/manganese transport system substrate-binding protein
MQTLLFALLAMLALPVQAALEVLACEPEWAALVRELGGDRVNVTSATTAAQDPHRIEARPSLIARARRADLVVCTGAELEAGWLPALLRESANPRIQPGQAGHFEAAAVVELLERPARIDRAEGDVHPQGNPHLHLDPRNIGRVAEVLARRLAQLDAAHAAEYARRQRDFDTRWQAAIARWEREAEPLKGVAVVSQHKALTYLYRWLGLVEVAVLEPKPGIEPSVAHLSRVLEGLKRRPARLVLRAAYEPPRASEWLAQRAGLRAVELPYTVGGSTAARDLFGLFDDTLDRLLAAAVP